VGELSENGGAASLPALLNDVTILDLAGESGLYCGKVLADLGADVIRVEPPGGDPLRQRPPFAADGQSLFYLHYNTNKRSITLDLTQAAGRRLFRQLAHTVDGVIETFAPGHLASLGVGYGALARRNPGLVLVSITPFGQRGPYRDYVANDLVAAGMGGIMWLSGFPEDPPNVPGGTQAYHYASVVAAAGALLALQGRSADPHGRGDHVDVSLEECVAMSTLQTANANYLTWHGQTPGRRGSLGLEGRSIYRCSDGWLSLVVPPYFWADLLAWLREEGVSGGLDEAQIVDLATRQQHAAAIAEAVAALCARYTRAEMMHQGQARRLLAAPVNAVDDLVADPQLQARHYLLPVATRQEQTRLYPGHPFHFVGASLAPFKEAAASGADNDAVYGDLLGLAPRRRAALREAGVM
jgi:benzylsuccinate CoA-transferase BbsE subunit